MREGTRRSYGIVLTSIFTSSAVYIPLWSNLQSTPQPDQKGAKGWEVTYSTCLHQSTHTSPYLTLPYHTLPKSQYSTSTSTSTTQHPGFPQGELPSRFPLPPPKFNSIQAPPPSRQPYVYTSLAPRCPPHRHHLSRVPWQPHTAHTILLSMVPWSKKPPPRQRRKAHTGLSIPARPI